jgi:hypothetical protein
MPSNSIIKRTSLCTKYNFDIWGKTIRNSKFLGLINRLYLSPRFMLEVRNALNRYRFIVEQGNTPLMFSFNQAFWRDWKKTKGAILAFRDPFPAFDRPKNMTQVLKKRSMHNFMHLKNLRIAIISWL